MSPEARADARSSPLPCETESERALGRQTITTGMPIESSPVTSATRVIPRTGSSRERRAAVASGATVRWVPARKALGTGPPGPESRPTATLCETAMPPPALLFGLDGVGVEHGEADVGADPRADPGGLGLEMLGRDHPFLVLRHQLLGLGVDGVIGVHLVRLEVVLREVIERAVVTGDDDVVLRRLGISHEYESLPGGLLARLDP